jgi:hypothetical protein
VGMRQGVWLATCFSMGPVGKGSHLLGNVAGLVCHVPLRARNLREVPAGQIKAFVRVVFNELTAFQKQSDNREVLWHRIMSPFSKCPYKLQFCKA